MARHMKRRNPWYDAPSALRYLQKERKNLNLEDGTFVDVVSRLYKLDTMSVAANEWVRIYSICDWRWREQKKIPIPWKYRFRGKKAQSKGRGGGCFSSAEDYDPCFLFQKCLRPGDQGRRIEIIMSDGSRVYVTAKMQEAS